MGHLACLVPGGWTEPLDLPVRWVQLVSLAAPGCPVFLELKEIRVVMVPKEALACKVPEESRANLACLVNLDCSDLLEKMEAMEKKEDLECLEHLDLLDSLDLEASLV